MKKDKKILIILGLIVIVVLAGIFLLPKKYKDTDYLIINNKGTLIGFTEYNETKKTLVKYNNDGTRKEETYKDGDTLIVLVKKEKKDVVVIPKEVKKIKKDLFIDTDYINTIKVEMNIEKIEDKMFKNSTFKKIILPKSITSIGKEAFMDNVYLKEVEGSVKYIEDSAFENDVSLNKIDLKSVKEVGEDAFKACTGIDKLYISKNIKSIGKDAFKYIGNRSIIYAQDNKVKKLLDDKYTIGKTTVVIDNKYFK